MQNLYILSVDSPWSYSWKIPNQTKPKQPNIEKNQSSLLFLWIGLVFCFMRRPFSVHLTSHNIPVVLEANKERKVQTLWRYLVMHMVARGKVFVHTDLFSEFYLLWGENKGAASRNYDSHVMRQTWLIKKPTLVKIKIFCVKILVFFCGCT